jgi:hypothetical protein
MVWGGRADVAPFAIHLGCRQTIVGEVFRIVEMRRNDEFTFFIDVT